MTTENFESSISSLLRKQYHMNLESVSFPNYRIPKYILLDRTRNIHSYFLFCRNESNVLKSTNWHTDNMANDLTQIVQTQYSELDRPLFIVIQDKDASLRIIEGNTIREKLLANGTADLSEFLLSESDKLQDVLMTISKEL